MVKVQCLHLSHGNLALFSNLLKCSFLHFNLSSSLESMFPSLSFTGMSIDWKPGFASDLYLLTSIESPSRSCFEATVCFLGYVFNVSLLVFPGVLGVL